MRSGVHMPAATIGIPNSGGHVCSSTVLSVCVWYVCLRLHACVNSTDPIALIAQIPPTACVFKSGDEAEKNSAAATMAALPFCFCFDSFLVFFIPTLKIYFFIFAQLQLRLQFRQGLFSSSLFPSPMRSPISQWKDKQLLRQ